MRCSRMFLFGLTLALTCGLSAQAAEPTDWPQWRGPQRDGHAAPQQLLTDWESTPPKLLWQVEGMGEGFSSVSVVDGTVYTTGNDDQGQFVVAVDGSTHSVRWKAYLTDKPPKHSYEGARCTPTIDGDRLYAVASSGAIACVNLSDGAFVWKKDFQQEWQGQMMSGWGFSESPLVDGDRVLCTPGGRNALVVALNKKDGSEVWRCGDVMGGERGNQGAGYSSIVISEAAGVKQYVQLTGRGVVGIRASDGKGLWSYNRVANGTANIPTPICIDDYVFCSTGYGTGAALLKLTRTRGGVNVNEQYFLDARTFQNHHGGMVRDGDYIYAGHGHGKGFPICIAWKTGKVQWGGDIRPEGSGSAAVSFADGHMIMRYQGGEVVLVEATPKEYRVKGKFRPEVVQGPSWAHPVVAGGKLYLREQNTLMCYDLSR